MFDIGWTELLVIAVVAIIIVGPKDLPRMLRSLGQYAGKLKRTANEFRSQFDEALRESEFDEIRSSVEELTDLNPVGQIRDAMDESLNPLKDSADAIKTGIEAEAPAGSNSETETDDPGPGDDPGAVEDSDAAEPEPPPVSAEDDATPTETTAAPADAASAKSNI